MKNVIRIERANTGEWRAVTSLPREMGKAVGVAGSETKEGPWTEGRGRTPEEALDSLYRSVGRAFVTTMGSGSEA